MPPNMAPIADACGAVILVGMVGEQRGKIYYWDHEFDDNLGFIANSFNEFLSSLYE